MDIKITRGELFKTAREWMNAHMDTEHMCKCDDCKAILKFLSKKEYKDISDAKTVELIVDNFGEYIEELTKDRLIEKEMDRATKQMIDEVAKLKKREMIFTVIGAIVEVLLMIVILICVIQDNYLQAIFNLGLILLIRTSRK